MYGTDDWEYILRMLQIASTVNRSLGVQEDATRNAYIQTQRGLFATIREFHIAYDDAKPYFERIARFVSRFYTILSLNYDLVLYWALLWSNDYSNIPVYFKDCLAFHGDRNGELDPEWQRYYAPHEAHGDRKPVVWWYPHGNLALVSPIVGRDRKIARSRGEHSLSDLLDKVAEEWEREDQTPLLVAEGESAQKEDAIARSDYLRVVLDTVIPMYVESNLVMYGFNMDDNDDHITQQLLGATDVSRVAFSLFTQGRPARWMRTRRRAVDKVQQISEQVEREIQIQFFHATSEGAWIYPKE